MINRRKGAISLQLKNSQKYMHSSLYYWIQNSLKKINFTLTDSTCVCQIHQYIAEKQNFIAIQMYVKPNVGLFKDVEFKPHVYFSKYDMINPPKVYNDRRIFHPNICVQTCSIVFSEITNWNPTIELQALLRKLKYVIIEPMPCCVPNYKLNIKAATAYLMAESQYQQLLRVYSPMRLEQIYSGEVDKEQIKNYSRMEIQHMSYRSEQEQFINVEEIIPRRRAQISRVRQKSEQQLNLLSKELKKMQFESQQMRQIAQSDSIKFECALGFMKNQASNEQDKNTLDFQIHSIQQGDIFYSQQL